MQMNKATPYTAYLLLRLEPNYCHKSLWKVGKRLFAKPPSTMDASEDPLFLLLYFYWFLPLHLCKFNVRCVIFRSRYDDDEFEHVCNIAYSLHGPYRFSFFVFLFFRSAWNIYHTTQSSVYRYVHLVGWIGCKCNLKAII